MNKKAQQDIWNTIIKMVLILGGLIAALIILYTIFTSGAFDVGRLL